VHGQEKKKKNNKQKLKSKEKAKKLYSKISQLQNKGKSPKIHPSQQKGLEQERPNTHKQKND